MTERPSAQRLDNIRYESTMGQLIWGDVVLEVFAELDAVTQERAEKDRLSQELIERLRDEIERPSAVRLAHIRDWHAARSDQIAVEYIRDLLTELDAVTRERDEALRLVKDLWDEDECWYDHHGYCQAHLWLSEGECPHARARKLLGGAT